MLKRPAIRLAAILLAVVPVAAGAAGLADVAATLRATSTMTADFTQTAPDGRIARGRMMIAACR
jgi:outer membrane lipoprotein-sorting protein